MGSEAEKKGEILRMRTPFKEIDAPAGNSRITSLNSVSTIQCTTNDGQAYPMSNDRQC